MANASDRRAPGVGHRFAAIGAFAALAAFAAAAAWPNLRERIYSRRVDARDIAAMLRAREAAEPMSDSLGALWETHRSLCFAFERVAVDLASRVDRGERYYDRDYVEQLASEIESHVERHPRVSLEVLSYYAGSQDRPLHRLMALIAIRELYPKKTSVFFANRYVDHEDARLAAFSRGILLGGASPGALGEMFSPAFIESLDSPPLPPPSQAPR